MDGLICSILEPKDIGNCSNMGISARCSEVTLLGVLRLDGRFESCRGGFAPGPRRPPVIIQERRLSGGKQYYSAYPCDISGNRAKGWFMFGGCFIKTNDSRFPFDYPVALHDRQE